MSSLHQDRLLIEGSGPVTGTASTLPTARGTRRRAVGSSEETATSKVPTPRPGTAQRPGTTQPTGDRTAPASRAKRASAAKAAAAATGTLASRAKAATVKVATAKTATAKAATAKAATAAVRTVSPAKSTRQHAAGAKRTVAPKVAAVAVEAPAAKPAAAKAVAKPAAAKATPAAKAATAAKQTKAPAAKAPAAKAPATKAPVTKAAAAKAAAAKAVATEAAVPAAKSVRPTPYKRATALADVPVMAPVADAAELLRDDAADFVVVRKDVVVEPAIEASQESTVARLPRFLRRRPPVVRHRPSLYLAAAVVGALGLGTITAGGPDAQATANMSHSVSVAEELGIGGGPTEAITPADATQRLGELAVSRNVRADEQAAAAQVQAEADRVAAEIAAEAARPKAVIPVQGARLTSTFGARWGTLHAGIDLAAPIGTPEYAAMDGVVLEAGPASGYGNAVYIQHENGDVTVYGHMEKILVTAGQVVKAGDTVALLGNRGQSTGPHLHFEVHVGGMDGQKVDPLPWLRERGVGI
jgi:murein DD-endopeptidase MepM/ murein hydrolase activator NlpD